jgi:GNAT superfamily N-acetyltransferase
MPHGPPQRLHETLDMPQSLIASPAGGLRLRPEEAGDRDFRFTLFCHSRPPELALLPLAPPARAQLMRQQFEAQTRGYAAQFPQALFDIVELCGEPIGRIVVDRQAEEWHLVDIALMPQWRSQGIGTAILSALIAEAGTARMPVRLEVGSSNDLAKRLYLRLGFAPTATTPVHVEMEWRPGTAAGGP